MRLSDLLENLYDFELRADPSMNVSQISSDSRSILKNGLFIAIDGTHHDGHDFISDAVKNGAAAALVSRRDSVPEGFPYVLVPDTRVAEAYVWDNWYGHPTKNMKVVAVTGTNGKTSTVFMLKSIFEKAGHRVGMITTVRAEVGGRVIGTFGGSSVSDAAGAMTTPDPEYLYGTAFAMKQAGADVLVFEASSHALSLHKTDPIAPDVAVFTNLSEEHLDYHGTMENYFRAKSSLAEKAKVLVVNADDAYMSGIPELYPNKEAITYSANAENRTRPPADVTALRIIRHGVAGVEYICFSKDAVFTVRSKIPGNFTVYNSLAAITAALAAGVGAEHARDGIASLTGVDGRLEAVPIGAPFTVFIDYAHTPDALENLLRTVREMREPGQKITLLFGCGGDRDRLKRRKMGAVASALADLVIVTSDNSRSEDADAIITEIVSGIDKEKPHCVIRDRREAIEYAVMTAEAGDVLLLAGKGHEKYEITRDGKKPFDEAQTVRSAFEKRKNKER